MDTKAKEIIHLQKILSHKILKGFIINNLRESLSSIGFSKDFVRDLLKMLDNLKKYPELQNKHTYELDTVYLDGFFKKIVPGYFKAHIVPEIPASKKVLDLGCGTGILAERLSREERFSKIIGIDLRSYPEWETFVNEKIFFTVANKDGSFKLIKEEKPNSIILTWTLHHMPYIEQKEYVRNLYSFMPYESKMIILEDSYSENLAPIYGMDRYTGFMHLSKKERKQAMSFYDWIANRVLAKRARVPITFSYRTLEEWESFFKEIGFSVIHKKFIGFPNKRDINTPQSLIVVEKKLKNEKTHMPKLAILQRKSGAEFNHIIAFKKVLSDKKIAAYIKRNFSQSLPTIGFSKSFVRDFIDLLDSIEDYKSFREKHGEEIHYVHSVIFFQHIVPDLFEKYVIPEIPKANLIMDIGCGTGFLADRLSRYSRFKEIIGIDVVTYPEWTQFISKKVRFVLITPDGFPDYIKTRRPDAIVITWTLQHLTLKQQENYIKKLHSVLKKGSRIVVMDDCYSESLKPRNGIRIYGEFGRLNRKDRDNVMYIYDWVANKILAQRDHATVQGSPYTTLEEREKFFDKLGFSTVKKVFIGFTKKRDTNTPLSLIVVEKR